MKLDISSLDLLKGILEVSVTSECTAGCEESYAFNKHSICRATGMSIRELNQFLDTNQVPHCGKWVDEQALPKLREWYLLKMRRFFRNGNIHVAEPGSDASLLFIQFVSTYHKLGHLDVKSWDDIDEFLLLRVFEEKCRSIDDYLAIEYRDEGALLDKIHHCFLFYLHPGKTFKYESIEVNPNISFILINRYHIFPSEEGSTADKYQAMAKMPITQWLNLPRSTTLYGLAS